MNIISLNVWCGLKYNELLRFLEDKSINTDIFCLSEVRNGNYLNQAQDDKEAINLFSDIEKILHDFRGYFTELVPGVGMAIFVKNNILVEKIESSTILSKDDISRLKTPGGQSYYPRIIQSLYLKDKNLIIHNFHGIPGSHKSDTSERELQTSRLLDLINRNKGQQIIIGDFNLDINTEAISRLENVMRNLIKEYKVKTTRNNNYGKFSELPFADYAFISKDLKINDFKVLPDEVSDHLALFLDIF